MTSTQYRNHTAALVTDECAQCQACGGHLGDDGATAILADGFYLLHDATNCVAWAGPEDGGFDTKVVTLVVWRHGMEAEIGDLVDDAADAWGGCGD